MAAAGGREYAVQKLAALYFFGFEGSECPKKSVMCGVPSPRFPESGDDGQIIHFPGHSRKNRMEMPGEVY